MICSSVPQYYCLTPGEGVNKELPKLLSSFHPHLDHVTHLEMCLHGDKLLLLSASSDCSLALSYLPGETVGFFGQVNKCTQVQRLGLRNTTCKCVIKSWSDEDIVRWHSGRLTALYPHTWNVEMFRRALIKPNVPLCSMLVVVSFQLTKWMWNLPSSHG